VRRQAPHHSAEPGPAADAASGPSTGCRTIPTARPVALRRLHSHALFDGAAEVEIEHDTQVYRLRRTALGKLILTK
jgi:hemin uptake protein HemP